MSIVVLGFEFRAVWVIRGFQFGVVWGVLGYVAFAGGLNSSFEFSFGWCRRVLQLHPSHAKHMIAANMSSRRFQSSFSGACQNQSSLLRLSRIFWKRFGASVRTRTLCLFFEL